MLMIAPDKQQVIRFNTLLGRLHLTDMKRDLIASATEGRTDHTLKMSRDELRELIAQLATMQDNTSQVTNTKRRRILSICHQLPHELGFTHWDNVKGRQVVNMEKLDAFLTGKKSIFKKPLNEHTDAELSRVIVQFENMLKGYLKK